MSLTSHFYHFDHPDWKLKLLTWASSNFPYLALTEGNGYAYPEGSFGDFLFLGEKEIPKNQILDSGIFKVGIFGYDFKNQIEQLESTNPDFFELPDTCFFEPTWKWKLDKNGFHSGTSLPAEWISAILKTEIPENPPVSCQITPQVTKEEYIQHIQKIQQEILEGSTYEANFCQAYSGTYQVWDPIAAYSQLMKLSPMPFSALFKADSKWLVSASPERFLKKTGNRLIAQPIKGTIRRGENPIQDDANRSKLLSSEKERAENLMITDLMRNDLARVSQTGSVQVEELFGIYPLPRVFQMISTVSSQLRPESDLIKIIEATFPMGSMTGAPKISTMKIIDREESFRRGWFSGAFGWVDEAGDFDFSVIIRSIITDLKAKKLYFGVGSAITIDASADQEFEECALKAQAILELLRGTKI